MNPKLFLVAIVIVGLGTAPALIMAFAPHV
jgi:hypothetical protein